MERAVGTGEDKGGVGVAWTQSHRCPPPTTKLGGGPLGGATGLAREGLRAVDDRCLQQRRRRTEPVGGPGPRSVGGGGKGKNRSTHVQGRTRNSVPQKILMQPDLPLGTDFLGDGSQPRTRGTKLTHLISTSHKPSPTPTSLWGKF